MKTKRVKKLLMGMGMSRDQANRMIASQRKHGSKKVSNACYCAAAMRTFDGYPRELLHYVHSYVLS